jgi:dihydrolipoamide dehydrogenase
MPKVIEVKVPDIGDFKDVPVIEVLVKPGDSVSAEDPLVSLESDKATLDVPSPGAGTVKDIKVKIGDKLSQGSLILTLETAEQGAGDAKTTAAPSSPAATAPAPASAAPPTPAAAKSPADTAPPAESKAPPRSGPAPASYSGKAQLECAMLVLGAGPGGYSAAFRSADLGMKTVLIERYPTLGGVCLNVGCIPSKALLHAAKVIDEAAQFADHGIAFGTPKLDLDKLRSWKSGVVGKLTGGLAAMAKARKVEVIQGVGKFLDPHHLAVQTDQGERVVRFDKAIIAAGSQPVKLPFIPDDPRIVDSTGALELRFLPKRLLVIGGGIIGLEMGTVYSALGAKLSVVEMLDGLMPGTDRDLVKVFEKKNAAHFEQIMLNTRVTAVKAGKDGLDVTFEGKQAPGSPQRYDMVLLSAGRTPNGNKIDAGKAGVLVSERGFIEVDKQMRTNVAHIYAIGDVNGQPMLAHKAVHEAHVAAEAAHGEKAYFDARVIPSVAYTDPEIAWVGLTEEQCKAQRVKYGKAVFPWAASGRAIANGRDEGFTKLLFDETTHRIIGGAIVGTNAGDLVAEIALAIEMGCDATDIGKTIHPHPTTSESIGMAAEVFEGVCTDLPPAKKK